jgi:hypothetical protein
MIEDRRALADALANEYEVGHTERMRVSFTAVQNTIEAIDRALRTRCSSLGEGWAVATCQTRI